MDDWTSNPMNAVTVGLALCIIILFIWISVIGGRLKKLRKQYTEVMGHTGVTNLEDVIVQLREEVAVQRQAASLVQSKQQEVQTILQQQKGKVGILRYNAFAEKGSDLSFSIAIVNEEKDGAVITSIHSRETSYVYAKPLTKGHSSYRLTPEELKVIAEAK